MSISDDAIDMAPELERLRHAIHREPEIGLQLPHTQEKVLDALDGLPLEVTTGEQLSSVTAVLRGSQEGPTVLLRADMDALALDEQVDVPYRSTVEGAMHACGHDAHTSMLMGAAHLLSARRRELAGNVVFMFQPGEEGHNGAGLMLDEGVLDASGRTPIAAYALHVMASQWARNSFVSRPGPIMAASDALYVTVKGSGGHGSAPHKAKDPVPATCEMVTALQNFLSREVDPFEPAVLTVGSIHAGTRRNIIAEEARFDATIRTFSPDVRALVAEGAVRVCQGIAAAHGLEVDARYVEEYPVTENSAAEYAFAGEVAAEVVGDARFERLRNPIGGSEDFSRVLDEVPGVMLFLGAAPEGVDPASAPDNHSGHARFDDGVLPSGSGLLAELAARRLLAEEGR